MKKVLLGIIFICAILFPSGSVFAADSRTEIKTQEELLRWYESDGESCYLKNDIIIDEYYEFAKTSNRKMIDAGEHSLIFHCGVILDNSKLEIIGTGADAPVVQLDAEHNLSARTHIDYLQIEATRGDALRIGRHQELEVNRNFNRRFPIRVKAARYALICSREGTALFYTAQFLTEQDTAVYLEPQSDLILRYCEVNHQKETDEIRIQDSYVNGAWMNQNGALDCEEVDPYIYVKSMEAFKEEMLPQFFVECAQVDLEWDLSTFDMKRKENVICAQVRINPLFQEYLDFSEVKVTVKEYTPIPLKDFQVDCLQEMYENIYRPYFKVTYPRGFEKVYPEVYRSEELLYREYDITWEIEFSYFEGETVQFMTGFFSEISGEELYYCRLRVEGGLNEGTSNFLKIYDGRVEDASPFPEEEEPAKPGEEPTKPGDGETLKPDESDPMDTVGGSGGHRGDQNREEIPRDDKEVILTPEQISALEKTGEDVVVIVDKTPKTVSHEEIKQWAEEKETVKVKALEENVKANDYSRASLVVVPIVIVACPAFVYRRKIYGK